MTKRLTLILGGARSGKSDYAQSMAEKIGGRLLYIATAEAIDPEMEARIRAHQATRGDMWQTLEAPLAVAAAFTELHVDVDCVLVDCITVLMNNICMHLGEDADEAAVQAAADAEIDAILAVCSASPAQWVIVSNEVGLGLVPPYPLGRVYRDVLGRVNCKLAQSADEVLFMAAGLPLQLK